MDTLMFYTYYEERFSNLIYQTQLQQTEYIEYTATLSVPTNTKYNILFSLPSFPHPPTLLLAQFSF